MAWVFIGEGDVGTDTGMAALLQGIDLEAGGRNKKTWRTAPKSDNVYLKLLVKVRTVPYPLP
jgi:hypothetical protein